jgi:hypothetical protein
MGIVDETLLQLSRTFGASFVLIAVAAAGLGMVALMGQNMAADPRIAAAARLAQQLCIGGAVLAVTGGVVAVASHWRSGEASLAGMAAGEAAVIVAGVVFAVAVRRIGVSLRERI